MDQLVLLVARHEVEAEADLDGVRALVAWGPRTRAAQPIHPRNSNVIPWPGVSRCTGSHVEDPRQIRRAASVTGPSRALLHVGEDHHQIPAATGSIAAHRANGPWPIPLPNEELGQWLSADFI